MSRTAKSRIPSGKKRQVFNNNIEKQIYKDATLHKAVPNHRNVNRFTLYYAHHNIARKQWDFETNMTHMKRNITLDIRLKAALKPLSKMDCRTFIESLEKSGSGLNYESLVNIALHEPRTFECLVEVAERYNHEVINKSNGETVDSNSLTNLPRYF
ncbi:Oidioi.mRNA.OKI2018_I69.XSR.g15684.t1.cds [Oikopleura dioica]|uniref:Oidioi.mRNA.OKI2018_I69.XSR.g15684.t1.cds n=1 Tax=Oikopleura dioica TaxID=34765 RepID=A0ABN7SK12_OIKDI|nr:Oidioi.mRNA.OKI2018_I69.XSR.g15684.t1.cds [Oikopleura dioica]